MVKPDTDRAPASRNARAHASNVAPVVITSSSSRIRKLSTRPRSDTAKAPRTASQRSSFRSKCFSGRGFDRRSNPGRYGRPSRLASGRPTRSTWLKPRSFRRCRCSGTGTMMSTAKSSASSRTISARCFANQPPRGSIRSNFRSRMARARAPSYSPKLRAQSNANCRSQHSRQKRDPSSKPSSLSQGWPQSAHRASGTRGNELRHASQTGRRSGRVNKALQMRHPEGKITQVSAPERSSSRRSHGCRKS